jgi:sugar phosphate isomerase/epimerase
VHLSLPFDEELALWDELGLRKVGLNRTKVVTVGRDAVVAALNERSMVTTTVSTGCFDLAARETWDETRTRVNDAIDLASTFGGCVYFTSGRRDGRTFAELTDSLADAIGPCVEYAASRGVKLAIEASLRTDVSYVHTLRDGLDVADRAGIDVIADLGNCWMERDYEDTVRRAASRIAAVQICDAIFGTKENPSPGGRVVPGDGDVPIDSFVKAAIDAGYAGAFELELQGPMIEAEGHAVAVRRGVERANKILEEVVGPA